VKTLFVDGAGRAAMFAARKIAMTGNQVMIFNRVLKLWIDQIGFLLTINAFIERDW
jgi:hypothetical protein